MGVFYILNAEESGHMMKHKRKGRIKDGLGFLFEQLDWWHYSF